MFHISLVCVSFRVHLRFSIFGLCGLRSLMLLSLSLKLYLHYPFCPRITCTHAKQKITHELIDASCQLIQHATNFSFFFFFFFQLMYRQSRSFSLIMRCFIRDIAFFPPLFPKPVKLKGPNLDIIIFHIFASTKLYTLNSQFTNNIGLKLV